MNVAPGAWRYALPALLAAPFALIFSTAVSVLALATGIAVLGFFRDPERTPPPTGVVSPADGKISVLREEGDRVRLGVFMNVWNVHVTRAPFDGDVVAVEHSPGAHRPAFSKDSDRNEKVYVRFARAGGDGDTDAEERTADASDSPPESDREVTLIAGAFARRIFPYVEAGDNLDRGERLGHIAFGSRVDVVFPPSVDREDVTVSVGDRVTAGETVVCETTGGDRSLDVESGEAETVAETDRSGSLEDLETDGADGADAHDADDADVATDGGGRRWS